MMSFWKALLCGWWIAILCSAASAEEKPIKISVRREWDGARTSAPLSLRAFLNWQRPDLLEGQLNVNAFVDSKRIGRWTSNETALSDSEQVLWFMLPRPVLVEQYERYVLQATLLSEKHNLDTEQLDVEVPVRRRRVMVIGIVLSQGTSTPLGLGADGAAHAYERPFLFQQNLIQEEGFALHVHPSRVKPSDFPTDPLRLLGLDALLISHDILNQLRPVQLEAIQTWVLAGGSLALIHTGRLERSAQSFVQDLSRNEWPATTRFERGLPAQATVFEPGLGQFIVVSLALSGDSTEWTRVARQMVRMQPEPAKSLESSSKVSLYKAAGPQLLEPLPRFDATELTNQLMPQSIRGMPFGLAASVLACCLFCIAPGDYLLLGLLKRRKWTWVLFPIVALSFTGWMAHLAAEHNGRNDSRTWLSIVDVTPENEVLRTSRFELTYGASGRTVAHAVQDQWWEDVRLEDFAEILSTRDAQRDFANWRYQQQQRSEALAASTELGERLSYHGSVPSHYIAEEPIRQWAPRMQRITTLGPDPALANYQLPQMDWEAAVSSGVGPSLAKFWPNAQWKLQGISSHSDWQPTQTATLSGDPTAAIRPFVDGLCGSPQSQNKGVFSFLSVLAPTAGADGEDLVITTRPTCLIINEVEPRRYLVVRVVFPTGSAVGSTLAIPRE